MTWIDDIRPLQNAMKYLAARDDGARASDSMGFNGLDTNFGQSLAKQENWTYNQAKAAHKMLKKYRRQLANGGFHYDAFRVPTEGSFLAYRKKQHAMKAKSGRKIDVVGDSFRIRFPYDQSLVSC